MSRNDEVCPRPLPAPRSCWPRAIWCGLLAARSCSCFLRLAGCRCEATCYLEKVLSRGWRRFPPRCLGWTAKATQQETTNALYTPGSDPRIACSKMQINTCPSFKVCHPPEFDFVQHTFGFVMGHTYQRLLVNGDELIPGSQAPILQGKEEGSWCHHRDRVHREQRKTKVWQRGHKKTREIIRMAM